jgi:tRNA nucleotidyltransferase (CCA-adding enzyme)
VKAFVVGGAVRDGLLGRPVADRDWVVVGATPAQMLAAGYLPVGRDFPVFLHPHTKEEYALARTERKTAPGYHGFVFHADADVTLEQDLARRDLTINAMALADDGTLIDPYWGREDLERRVLRHVSPAFTEDPVRILRLARFAARFTDFRVAAPTLELARRMVQDGEVDALVPERVWQELSSGLMEARPSRMLEVLRGCAALARLLPELDRLWEDSQGAEQHVLRVIDLAAQRGVPLPVRFACLVHDVGPARSVPAELSAAARTDIDALCARLRVPAECHALALMVARESASVHDAMQLDAAGLLGVIERCDAVRRPGRFAGALLACELVALASSVHATQDYPPRQRFELALQRALGVDSTSIVERERARGASGPALGSAIRDARVQAIKCGLVGAAR